jgi:hypothetical protein
MATGPQNGTGFTNLSNIINANQGNQLGQTIQSGLQGNIAGLQNQVGQATNTFNTAANAANTNTAANNGLVSNTISGIMALANPPANANAPQATTAPTTAAAAPSQTQTNTQAQSNGESTFLPSINKAIKASLPPGAAAPSTPTAPPPVTAPAATTPTASTAATPAAAPAAAAPGSFGTSTVGSGANTTATTNTPNAGTLAQFGNLLQGSYTGPQQLSNYNQLLANSQNLQAQGQQAGTAGGQQALLQQYMGGNKNYTTGEQGLDQLLLGQAQPQLQSILNQTRNLTNIPNQANAQAQQLAQSTAAGNQQFAQGIQNQITQAENPILGNIQQNINTLNAQNAAYETPVSQIQSLLSAAPLGANVHTGGMGMNNPTLAMGGTNPQTNAVQAINLANQNGLLQTGQYQNLMNLIPQLGSTVGTQLGAAFTNNVPSNYTLQQGANATQAAQLNALQQLAGQTGQYGTYGGATPANAYFDPSKLPGYVAPAVAATPGIVPNPKNMGIGGNAGGMGGGVGAI